MPSLLASAAAEAGSASSERRRLRTGSSATAAAAGSSMTSTANIDTVIGRLTIFLVNPRQAVAGALYLAIIAAVRAPWVSEAIFVYGLRAFVVSQRTSELGMRIALGAGGASVLRLVLKDGL